MTMQSQVKMVLVCLILVIYVITTGYLVFDVFSPRVSLESMPPGFPLPSVYKTVLGLLSAVVIAELAITLPPKQQESAPTADSTATPPRFGALLAGGRSALETTDDNTKRVLDQVTTAYVLTWLGVGFLTFLIGGLFYFEQNSILSNSALEWFGLAIGAGYAFFGIKPDAQNATPATPGN